jgi:hypothetical protein
MNLDALVPVCLIQVAPVRRNGHARLLPHPERNACVAMRMVAASRAAWSDNGITRLT